MTSRLAELLERIRPAGTPGSPSDLVSRYEQAVADEIAALAEVLAGIDDEVDDVLADARTRAERLRSDAERRAAELRSDLPDRIAVAESTTPEPAGGVADPVAARAAVESDREIRRLRERATSRMPDLVERAVAVIWDVAEAGGSRREAVP